MSDINEFYDFHPMARRDYAHGLRRESRKPLCWQSEINGLITIKVLVIL